MFSIQVVNKQTGTPQRGRRVSVGFHGFSRSFSESLYTNDDGIVHFDHRPGKGDVYIDGKKIKLFDLHGMVVVYV